MPSRFMSRIIVILAAVLWVAADLWSQSLLDSVLTAGAAARPDTPLILFTSVPAFGSFTGLKGKVYNVDPRQYRVAVFIFISGFGWWSKPYCNETTVAINPSDDSWTADFPPDWNAEKITAYVVPATFQQSCVWGGDGIPDTTAAIAVAHVLAVRRNPNTKVIRFSGFDWAVKSSRDYFRPWENYFSDAAENVSVDSQGRLHLKITYRDGKWNSAEVALNRPLGLGEYRFILDTPVGDLGPNVVLGLSTRSTWSDDPNFSHSEFEIDMFGWYPHWYDWYVNPTDSHNAQVVLHRYPWNSLRFTFPDTASPSLQSFDWRSESITFSSYSSDTPSADNLVRTWTVNSTIPNADEAVWLNLSLGDVFPPAEGREVEVIIRRFEFVAAAKPNFAELETITLNGAANGAPEAPGGTETQMIAAAPTNADTAVVVPPAPLLWSGRLSVENSETSLSAIVLSNPHDDASLVSWFFTDERGTDFGHGSLTLSPWQHVAVEGWPFGFSRYGVGRGATFTLQASLPIAVAAFQVNPATPSTIATLPIVELTKLSDDFLHFAHFVYGGTWSTELVVMNPTNEDTSGTIEFRADLSAAPGAGRCNPITSISYHLAGRTSRRIQVIGPDGSICTGSVTITPENGSKSPYGLLTFQQMPAQTPAIGRE